MLQSVLKFEEMPKYLDATDGLAVALCHHYSKVREKTIRIKLTRGEVL